VRVRLVISKGPKRVGGSLPSPEDRNRSSFRNDELEFRTMDNAHKCSDSEWYTPSSEPSSLNEVLLYPTLKYGLVSAETGQIYEGERMPWKAMWCS
jgi:hypothetical protein